MQFDPAIKTGDEFDAKFFWSAQSNGFSLSAIGVLSLTSHAVNTKVKLPIEKEEFIVKLLVQSRNNDLVLAFETSNGDGGRGFICHLKWPQNTIRWCQTIPGFNVYASSSMGSIYIGAIGFLGRLNPKNGKYIWKHDGLYESDRTLNLVCLASENDTNVIFNATSGNKGTVAKQIILDRSTGKIIQKSNMGKVNVCD